MQSMRWGGSRVAMVLAIAAACLAVAADAGAQDVPHTMTVQGILRDAAGEPVLTNTMFAFELLDGSRVVWTESQSVLPRDDQIFAARAAPQVYQPSLELPAVEILLELAHHELRQPAGLVRALEQRRPVRAQHAVKNGVLGTTPHIAVRAGRVSVRGVSNGCGDG